MTAKEAFEAQEILKEFRKGLDSLSESKLIDALDLAIKALGKDTNVPSNDTISRKQAIDAICNTYNKYGRTAKVEELASAIKWLPPAQPEIIRCKDCGHWDTTWQNDFAPNYHYCPLVDGTRRCDFYCADAERRTDETN